MKSLSTSTSKTQKKEISKILSLMKEHLFVDAKRGYRAYHQTQLQCGDEEWNHFIEDWVKEYTDQLRKGFETTGDVEKKLLFEIISSSLDTR